MESTSLLDEIMPLFDAASEHRIRVAAPPNRVYEHARRLKFGDSPIIRMLFSLRSFPALLTQRGKQRKPSEYTLDHLIERAFTLVCETPNKEFVLGLIGQPWTPAGKLRHVDASTFQLFDDESFARITWSFSVESGRDGSTLLRTQTRVQCLSDGARKRFLRYWRVIGPFSGIIRREALRSIKRSAERS